MEQRMQISSFIASTVFIIACAMLLGLARQAAAGFQVTLDVDGTSTTITDGGAGDGDSAVNNQIIIVSTTVDPGGGGYTFTLTLAKTNTPGGGSIAFVNSGTNSILDSGEGAAKISIIISANDFTSPITPPPLNAFSGATGQLLPTTPMNNTATVSYSAFVDELNVLTASSAGSGTLVGSGVDTITQPGDNNASLNDAGIINSLSSPYALHLILMAELDQPGSEIDLDGELLLTPVPEPASILLIGIGTIGLGYLGRRRRNKIIR